MRIRKSSIATQAMRICERATRVLYASGDKREKLLSMFCNKQVGGSTLEEIVDQPEKMQHYIYQRTRLEQLKERMLRRIKSVK